MNITDQEFAESGSNRERMYRDELKRSPVDPNDPNTNPADITYMDILGRGRWPVDYITARQAGHSHANAMQVERVRIREAAGLPATEPMPTPPVTPTPPQPQPPQPPTDPAGVKDNMDRFVDFYGGRCRQTGWSPDHTTNRDQRVMFLRDTILAYRVKTGDTSFVMKRADASRPISDEAVVFTTKGDYRRFWDFIINGGSKDWHLAIHGDGEILPIGQLLVDPVTLQVIPG